MKLITYDQLADKGIRATLDHLRKLWKLGLFPVPIHLTARKIAWDEAEIDSHIEARARARVA